MVKRSDGRYQASITVMVDGKPKRKYFYGSTKAELNRNIAAYNAESERAKTEAALGRIFREVAEEWWEETERSLAPNSLKNYKPAYERAKAHFGSKRIRELRPADVSRFLRDYVADSGCADKTARTQLLVCSRIFHHGIQCGDCDINAAAEVEIPRGLKKEKRTMPTKKDIDTVRVSVDKDFGLFAFMAMYTGLRRGELLALTWEDIDLDARTIRVSKSLFYSGSPKIKAPKTEAGIRVVPILDRLLPHLVPKSGPVFNAGGQYLTEGQFLNRWNRYLKETGITCTPHQLRHAYATMLYEAGIQPADMQVLLGHSEISTTMDVYNHIREEHMQKVRSSIFSADF